MTESYSKSLKNTLKINNKLLVFSAITLAILGLVFQYSASSYSAMKETGDSFFYVKKQAVSLVVALICLFGMKFINTEKIIKAKWYILAFSVILLAIIFIPGLGIEKFGARRWLNLGITTLQPSEISKFGLVIFIACELSQKSATTFFGMLKILLATAVVCVLIMFEPNMSITMCVGLVVMIMLFVGGAKFKHFVAICLPAIALVVVLILIEPYRLKRLVAFMNPWANPLGEGYQLIQSYYALGSGGLFGLGLFNSRQKYLFLPFAESDFIFSIIGEETGLFGCIFVITLFLFVIFNGVKISMNATTRLDCYIACGITAVIAIQSMLNIAVVSGSIPPTGLPLPFVSAGGSSLVVFIASVGILDNIAGKTHNTIDFHKLY